MRPPVKPLTDPLTIHLLSAWVSAHAEYGVPAARSEFDAVLAAYGEPGRHYHTAVHIDALLSAIEAEPSFARCEDVGALKLAVFFHDLVYQPLSVTNEADSEARWTGYARRVGFPPSVREEVGALILSTASHQVHPKSPFLIKAMNDIDMGILAAPPQAYRDYAQKVWKEFSVVGREGYKAGRLQFLRSLDPARLFFTEPYQPRAAVAKANIAWEIRALTEKPELVLVAV